MATATSSARAPPGASLWMRRRAPASRSRPIGRKSSTALIEAWSISSTSEARTVRPSSMTAAAAAATVGKVATTVEVGAWAGTQPQGGPGDDAEGALRADEELEQRQARDVLDPLAAEGDQGAVGEHHVEAEHVVGGDPVLHAAQAAGVGRDVAADRADLVRAGVRRVPEALRGGGPLHLDVEGAGLDHGDPAGGVDLDRAHPLGRQHDAAVDGERPAGQPGARRPAARPGRRARSPSASSPAPARRPRPARRRAGCRRWRRGSSRSGTSPRHPRRRRRPLRAAARRARRQQRP